MKYTLTKYEQLTDCDQGERLEERRKIALEIINHKCDLCQSPATAILKNWWTDKFYGCDGHTIHLISKHNAEVKFSPYNINLIQHSKTSR